MTYENNKTSRPISHYMTFFGMYIGYTLAILNRKSFSFVLPRLVERLDFGKSEAGLISSSQNLAYTFSKFAGGILCDTMNVKMLFCVGVLVSGLLTVSLAFYRTAGAFALILFLQGLSQGGAWPSCAKMLKGMFSSNEFGIWYSVLNTGMNVACSFGPILIAIILNFYSWHFVFIFSGLLAIIGSLLGFFLITYPPNHPLPQTSEKNKSQLKGRGTWKDLLESPFMWTVSFCYLVTFMARTAALDWGQLFLITELGHSNYIGSLFISSMEIGGIIGSVIAGYLADLMVAKNKQDTIVGSPRMTVSLWFIILFTLSIHSFIFFLSSSSSEFIISLVGFLMGFGAYGPISIYGVMAIEASPLHLQGTSHAFVSLAANIGAVMAGFPLSLVARQFNWKGAFVVMETFLIITITTKIFTKNFEYKMVLTKKKIQ